MIEIIVVMGANMVALYIKSYKLYHKNQYDRDLYIKIANALNLLALSMLYDTKRHRFLRPYFPNPYIPPRFFQTTKQVVNKTTS